MANPPVNETTEKPTREGSTHWSAIVAIAVAVLGAGGIGTTWVQGKNDVKELEAKLKLEQERKADAEGKLGEIEKELAKREATAQERARQIASLRDQLGEAKQKADKCSGNTTVTQTGNNNAGINSSVRVREH